jgi:hypothetical protein
MMAQIKRWWNRSNAVKTSGGAANVQTLTYDVAEASYYTGQRFTFIAGFTNTAATTLNVNALGAKNVKLGSNALNGGEIVAGFPVDVVYDGTQFQLLSATQQEGTWTPVLAFSGLSVGITYSIQDGTYSRVGDVIVATFDITLTSKGSSTGSAGILGLPFASARTVPCSIGLYQGMSGMGAGFAGTYVASGTTTVTLVGPGAATVTNVADTNFGNGSRLSGSCVYR